MANSLNAQIIFCSHKMCMAETICKDKQYPTGYKDDCDCW